MSEGDLMMSEIVEITIGVTVLILVLVVVVYVAKREEAKKEKMKSIYAAITVSHMTSLQEIAKVLHISPAETKKLMEAMIKRASNLDFTYRAVKNAYIDYEKNKIVLDPNASKGFVMQAFDTLFKRTASKKQTWSCPYCETMNQAKIFHCHNCGAARREG